MGNKLFKFPVDPVNVATTPAPVLTTSAPVLPEVFFDTGTLIYTYIAVSLLHIVLEVSEHYLFYRLAHNGYSLILRPLRSLILYVSSFMIVLYGMNYYFLAMMTFFHVENDSWWNIFLPSLALIRYFIIILKWGVDKLAVNLLSENTVYFICSTKSQDESDLTAASSRSFKA